MDSPPETPSLEMVICPKCNSVVSKKNLDKHLKRVHSTENELRAISNQNFEIVRIAYNTYLSTVIKCCRCKQKIRLVEVKSHFAIVHNEPAPREMLAILGVSEPNNMFKSERERERFWREKSGFEPNSSDELFDRTKVLSGGTFGLGKSRK